MHPAIIIGTIRLLWTWLWGRYHVPQNVFLVIIIIIVLSIIRPTIVLKSYYFWQLKWFKFCSETSDFKLQTLCCHMYA